MKKKRLISEEKLRGNFYSFQKKTARLEELRRELQSLQSKGVTRGFEKEVGLISSRLKDTTSIPELEGEMRSLRQKIKNKHEIKRKSPIKLIEKKVSNIGSEVEGTTKQLKSEMEGTTKQLKSEIKNLKLKIDESLEKSGHIDSEVGLKVDESFQNFIKEIKLDLSEKVKNKEKELNESLKRDLAVRRVDLDVKYRNMQEDLEKNYQKKMQDVDLLKKELKNRYQQKLKDELDTEVKARASGELRKRFEEERARLDLEYVSRMKKKYNDEFLKQRVILDRVYKEKIAEGLKKLNADYDIKKKALEDERRKNTSKLKSIDYEKERQEQIFRSKLEKLSKERMENKAKMLLEHEGLKKKLTAEAHQKIAKEIDAYKGKLDSELKDALVVRMNAFVNGQKKKQEIDIEKRTYKIRQALQHEKKINDMLRHNLSEKTSSAEKLKELNDKLKKDLVAGGREFDARYDDMEKKLKANYEKKLQEIGFLKKELNKKYLKKLKNELDKEVNARFSEELKNKFEEERKKLDFSYISRMKKKYSDEMQKKKDMLEEKYKKKVDSELKKLDSDYRIKRKIIEDEHKKNIERSKDIEEDKRRHMQSFSQKLSELNKKREMARASIISEQQLIKKRLEEEAHQKMSNELKIHKKRVESELRNELSMKMNAFINGQKKKQESDIGQRTDKIRQALQHEHKINDILRKNLSEETYNIEKLKELNRKTVSDVSDIKHKESLKRAKEHKKLIAQHKKDIDYLTSQLKKDFYSKFGQELQKHISLEKEQLDKEFTLKLAESKEKLKDLSGREVREFKSKLRSEYDDKFRKNIELKKEKLQNEMRKQFFRESNEKILLERQKLDDKLRALEKKYKMREDDLRKREKHFVKVHKAKALFITSEKKSLMERMNLFKRSEGEKMDAFRKEEQKKLKQKELRLAEEAHREMLKELRLREVALKERLQRHFDKKVKEYKEQEEREITSKKAQLAEELRQRAKALVG
ncbi:hypothetical protein COU56_04405 [Candidatus Pacearchaeota archaeon CG10_big_fil_rev_8_21_14_0_10_31_9]|nr:MAG: hypothetical protein COU56_04405 [Candidatus Pacearchaeota archaeon CG10_big_fil_rev_8_21_14_0_10_31_9]